VNSKQIPVNSHLTTYRPSTVGGTIGSGGFSARVLNKGMIGYLFSKEIFSKGGAK
jgi:hypothetical protein